MLIGLCGKPHSGKSEVKRILSQHYGFHVLDTKIYLREMASILTGVSSRKFATQEGKQELFEGVPLRKIMGELGNVAEKLWGDSYMIKRALGEDWNYTGKRIVVDSLRKSQPDDFPGLVVEVISEKAIDTGNDFDRYTKSTIQYKIFNDGSFEDLEKAVGSMLDEYGIY